VVNKNKGENLMITLGQKARDKVTGLEGILTARATYLYGCDQYGITPPAKEDGTCPESVFVDEGRIEIIGRGVLPEEVKSDKNGGVQRDCPKINLHIKG
jgi:hypothetical protein